MTQPNPSSAPADRHAGYNRSALFWLSVIALISTGMSFSLRSNIAEELRIIFLEPIDMINSAKYLGAILGVAFLGYAITIPIASAILDILGMKRILVICSFLLTLGTLMIILAQKFAVGHVYAYLWTSFLILGLGWGLVEAVINPMTATLYPEDKTHRLNVLHAWWPGGIIIGGLLGLGLGALHMNWQVQIGVTLIPMVIFGVMAMTLKFPVTERAAAGVSTGTMMKEAFKPLYIILFLAMFGTAASELAPGQWVDMALTRTVGMRGIWLLIYVSGMMFVLRHFAGPIVHKINPIGLMWLSCLLAAIGLFAMSFANSPVMALLAATLWGWGVCYMWPTMYAISNEQFPKGGAFLMGLIGCAGCLSIYFVLPQMGRIFDFYKVKYAGGNEAFKALTGQPLNDALAYASQWSFRWVAVLPLVLLVVFGIIWIYFQAKGGYKPVKIEETK